MLNQLPPRSRPPLAPPPPGPQPPAQALAPGTYKGMGVRCYKFIPAPEDIAGQKLRALKDKHNARETKRRQKRLKEKADQEAQTGKGNKGNGGHTQQHADCNSGQAGQEHSEEAAASYSGGTSSAAGSVGVSYGYNLQPL